MSLRLLAEDFLEWEDSDLVPRPRVVVLRIRFHHAGVDRRGLDLRLVHGRAGREARDHLGHAMAAALHHQRARVVLAHDHVQQRIHRAREVRGRLHDADDLHRLAAEPNVLADDPAITAESLHPVLVREDHDRRDVHAIIGVGQQATRDGGQPHHVEVVAGDEADGHTHRVLLPLQRVDHPRVLGDAGEALGALAEIVDLGDREVHVLSAGSCVWRSDRSARAGRCPCGAGGDGRRATDVEDGGVRGETEAEGGRRAGEPASAREAPYGG